MGKIEEEDFKMISDLKQQTSQIVYSLGELEYQKTTIDFVIEDIKLQIKALRKEEADLVNQLKTKYGNVSINIETGEF